MEIVFCHDCMLELYEYGGEGCPKCGSKNVSIYRTERRKPEMTVAISKEIDLVLAQAESLVKSPYQCICSERPSHVMTWPKGGGAGKRTKLTNLPFCPFRIIRLSPNLDMSDRILNKLRIGDSESGKPSRDDGEAVRAVSRGGTSN